MLSIRGGKRKIVETHSWIKLEGTTRIRSFRLLLKFIPFRNRSWNYLKKTKELNYNRTETNFFRLLKIKKRRKIVSLRFKNSKISLELMKKKLFEENRHYNSWNERWRKFQDNKQLDSCNWRRPTFAWLGHPWILESIRRSPCGGGSCARSTGPP